MEPHRTGQDRIHISGKIAVDSGNPVAVALALHELATNAVKTSVLRANWKRSLRMGAAIRVRLRWLKDGRPCWPQDGMTSDLDSSDADWPPSSAGSPLASRLKTLLAYLNSTSHAAMS